MSVHVRDDVRGDVRDDVRDEGGDKKGKIPLFKGISAIQREGWSTFH